MPPDIIIDKYLPRCEEVWRRTLDQHGSMDGYDSAVRLHILPFFAGTRVADWKPWLIHEFIKKLDRTIARTAKGTPFTDGRKLRKESKKRILAILSGICSIAIDDGLLEENPVKNYVRKLERYGTTRGRDHARAKPIQKWMALTEGERDRVLVAARTVLDLKYSSFYHFLAGTGARPSEAAALRWKDVDLEGKTTGGVPVVFIRFTIKRGGKYIGKTKSGRSRPVELHPSLIPMLTALKATVPHDDKDFVFTRLNGRPFSQAFRNQVWALVLGLAGIERWLPVYCLRHTYASILIGKGASITRVSQQLGHYNDEVTRTTYYHWLPVKSNPDMDRLGLKTA
ncbi:MAG: site-specific integrase [Nitrospiraceae bacterium]